MLLNSVNTFSVREQDGDESSESSDEKPRDHGRTYPPVFRVGRYGEDSSGSHQVTSEPLKGHSKFDRVTRAPSEERLFQSKRGIIGYQGSYFPIRRKILLLSLWLNETALNVA